MPKALYANTRNGRRNYCIELSPDTQQIFRAYAKKHGLYQYEVFERFAKSLNEPAITAVLQNTDYPMPQTAES